eukprot:2037111-Rhodomonas_salina.1
MKILTLKLSEREPAPQLDVGPDVERFVRGRAPCARVRGGVVREHRRAGPRRAQRGRRLELHPQRSDQRAVGERRSNLMTTTRADPVMMGDGLMGGGWWVMGDG